MIKVLAIIFLFSVPSSAGIIEPDFNHNSPSSRDHAYVWAVGTFAFTGWLRLFPISSKKATLIGATTMMGLGVLKEATDKTGFSVNDLYHDGIGTFAGAFPFIVSWAF